MEDICSAPGVANTNNALELFNKTIKKNYTLGTCHSLPALLDIVMEKLLFNFSLDIIAERKIFEERRNPCSKVRQNSNAIDDVTYRVRSNELLYTFTKLENNQQHVVDFGRGVALASSS